MKWRWYGVWTEIKIGVSTGKSIPHRLKFSSVSSDGGETAGLTDRQTESF